MKKIISSLALTAVLAFGLTNVSLAVPGEAGAEAPTEAASSAAKEEASSVVNDAKEGATKAAKTGDEEVELNFIQTLKQQYIEGDVVWMTPVLICLIIGIAL